MTLTMHELPVVVIGAGPVGLATAAHLLERGLRPIVLEAGPTPAAAVRQWGHTRLFSPWRYNIDDAARRLLEPTGWRAPDPDSLPTGHELIRDYLDPLVVVLDSSGPVVRTGARVVAVSRDGIDKTRSADRESTPFLVRVESSGGEVTELRARSVIDASGTWGEPNPLGRSGMQAPGEAEAIARGLVTAPLPDVSGSERAQFASRHVLVVLEREDQVTWKSLRNVPSVHLIHPDQLNTYDVLVSDDVVFTTEALETFIAGRAGSTVTAEEGQ